MLVENFSPGTIDRLGFGYEAVHERNPALVFASISGFGQTGPSRSRTAYDLIVQGMSGMMSVTGEEGGMPTKLGIPIADIAAGMFAAYAIAGALYGRERDPEHLGHRVDTSMLGGQVALLTYQAGIYFTTGQTPTMLGNRHPDHHPVRHLPNRRWACQYRGGQRCHLDPLLHRAGNGGRAGRSRGSAPMPTAASTARSCMRSSMRRVLSGCTTNESRRHCSTVRPCPVVQSTMWRR